MQINSYCIFYSYSLIHPDDGRKHNRNMMAIINVVGLLYNSMHGYGTYNKTHNPFLERVTTHRTASVV